MLSLTSLRPCGAVYRRLQAMDCSPCIVFLEFFFSKILGRFLVVFVYLILGFMVFVVYAIVAPYEAIHQPPWSIGSLVLFATYLFLNVFYNYWKASTLDPGSPPKVVRPPICYKCQYHKPAGCHHCSMCQKCILRMDHHCVWINQCVGAGNHRHFLQFLAFLTTGCGTFVLGAYRTFYYNYWHTTTNQLFCLADIPWTLPWFDFLCSKGHDLIISIVFFSYYLCLLVFFVVGALFWWNFVLISAGETYIGVLKKGTSARQILRMIAFPFRNEEFEDNWRRFLGISRGSGRSFLTHVLLPSGYVAYEGNTAEKESLRSMLRPKAAIEEV